LWTELQLDGVDASPQGLMAAAGGVESSAGSVGVPVGPSGFLLDVLGFVCRRLLQKASEWGNGDLSPTAVVGAKAALSLFISEALDGNVFLFPFSSRETETQSLVRPLHPGGGLRGDSQGEEEATEAPLPFSHGLQIIFDLSLLDLLLNTAPPPTLTNAHNSSSSLNAKALVQQLQQRERTDGRGAGEPKWDCFLALDAARESLDSARNLYLRDLVDRATYGDALQESASAFVDSSACLLAPLLGMNPRWRSVQRQHGHLGRSGEHGQQGHGGGSPMSVLSPAVAAAAAGGTTLSLSHSHAASGGAGGPQQAAFLSALTAASAQSQSTALLPVATRFNTLPVASSAHGLPSGLLGSSGAAHAHTGPPAQAAMGATGMNRQGSGLSAQGQPQQQAAGGKAGLSSFLRVGNVWGGSYGSQQGQQAQGAGAPTVGPSAGVPSQQQQQGRVEALKSNLGSMGQKLFAFGGGQWSGGAGTDSAAGSGSRAGSFSQQGGSGPSAGLKGMQPPVGSTNQ